MYLNLITTYSAEENNVLPVTVNCDTLRMGQYICPDPHINHIDPRTQQFKGCTEKNVAKGMYFCVN